VCTSQVIFAVFTQYLFLSSIGVGSPPSSDFSDLLVGGGVIMEQDCQHLRTGKSYKRLPGWLLDDVRYLEEICFLKVESVTGGG
jgi:hypothetical protein